MEYLAKMISNIKVGILFRSKYVVCKKNNLCVKCLILMYDLGLISGFSILNKNIILINLKYINNRSSISSISFSGGIKKKNYLKKKNFIYNNLNKNFNYSFTYLICSTSKGIYCDTELNLKNIGGLLLMKIS